MWSRASPTCQQGFIEVRQQHLVKWVLGTFDDAIREGSSHHRDKNQNACLHERRWPSGRQPKRSTNLALSRLWHSTMKPGNKTSGRELREPHCSYFSCSCALSIRRQPTTNPMTSRRYRRTSTQYQHHQKCPTPTSSPDLTTGWQRVADASCLKGSLTCAEKGKRSDPPPDVINRATSGGHQQVPVVEVVQGGVTPAPTKADRPAHL